MPLNITLEVDTKETKALIDQMYYAMKPAQFEHALYGIYKRTGGHVRAVLKKDLPKSYKVKAGDVGYAVKNPKMMGHGCIIPIRDKRKNIGTGFTASGGAHGWNVRKGKRYKIKAKILKAGSSVLPDAMPPPGYTGNPPFRNLSSPMPKLTFTRKGKARLPILKVSGIAIPQMPTNRAQDDVQDDIAVWLQKQVRERFLYMCRTGK